MGRQGWGQNRIVPFRREVQADPRINAERFGHAGKGAQGHTGDLLGGSHVRDTIQAKMRLDVADRVGDQRGNGLQAQA